MSWLMPIIGAGLTLTGQALDYFGTRRANRENRRLAREQMAFQQKSSDTQMGFQERLSNTAYQRAVADMEQAGINPVLAYQQGGASSPGGSSSSGASAHMSNRFANAVTAASSIMQLLYLKSQIDQTNAQTENIQSDSHKKRVVGKAYNIADQAMDKVMQVMKKPFNYGGSLRRE